MSRRYPRPGVYWGDEYQGRPNLDERLPGGMLVGICVEKGQAIRWLSDEEYAELFPEPPEQPE